MKKEIIEISYIDLRTLSENMITMISEETKISKEKISIKSSINNQLGIDGDDWISIKDRLRTDFNCSLSGFKFHEYFFEEGENVLSFPLMILDLIAVPIKLILYLIISLYDRGSAMKIWNYKLIKRKPDLKIEDLITSILKNKWKPKNQVEFTLN